MLTDKEAKTIFKQTFDDWYFYEYATWKLKFIWLPKRCDKSNKLLWLKYGYKGKTKMFTIISDIDDIRWVSIEEFTLFALKKTIHR